MGPMPRNECVSGKSQRDFATKPRVARNELPWVKVRQAFNPEGVVAARVRPAVFPCGHKTCRATGHRKFSICNLRLALLLIFLLSGAFLGCSPKKSETPEQRSEAARTLFEHTTKTFHIPSAEAKGTEKERLQSQAADGYTQLLKL